MATAITSEPKQTGKLIIVSNRVAIPNGKSEAGGLAVALQEALKAKGGVWIGWSGNIREYPKTTHVEQDNISYVTQDFTKDEHEDFYLGFSNSMLWPLFHYRIGQAHYNQHMFEGYERVNEKFAECVAKHTDANDVIWVHDYHLLSLGSHLRRKNIPNRTGFFLHIPFPVPNVLSVLPVHLNILKAMCAYDLLGFQTQNDVESFIECLNKFCGGKKIAENGNTIIVSAFGRKFKVGCFPISIDTQAMIAAAENAEGNAQNESLAASLNGRKMIIGVDRLDYTKGIPARIQAYHHFLQRHPEHKGNVSYIQITPPSRTDVEEYQDLREEVEGLVAHVNGVNADIDWVPLRYINKSFSRDELAGFYRVARVALVTPVRDGMNLVAKEYVASQNPEDPGVLILSQFAGAAYELNAALVVNPYDEESLGEAIYKALHMSLEERKVRHRAMMKALKENTIFDWTKNFLTQLAIGTEQSEPRVPFKQQMQPAQQVFLPIPATTKRVVVM